jgi:hypothetical protein
LHTDYAAETQEAPIQLSHDHENTMNELVEEHIFGHKIVSTLFNSRELHQRFSETGKGYNNMHEGVRSFYQAHIGKEDKHYFYQPLEYFGE